MMIFGPKTFNNNCFLIEADCWMSGQCWMTMTPNNMILEVKTWFSCTVAYNRFCGIQTVESIVLIPPFLDAIASLDSVLSVSGLVSWLVTLFKI